MIGQRAIFDMKKVKENDYTTPRLQNIEESKISVVIYISLKKNTFYFGRL